MEKNKKEETIKFELANNVLKWYSFRTQSSVLLVGKYAKVWKTYLKSKQLDVVISDDVPKEKFDYIIICEPMIKSTEYSEVVYEYSFILNNAKKSLKKDGHILFLVNNKFGIGLFSNKKTRAINKHSLAFTDLTELVSKTKLKSKMYYPLTDYYQTNVVFTDKYLPTTDTLNKNLEYPKCASLLLFHQNDVYRNLIEDDANNFKQFANSYFVDLSKDGCFDDVKYISFSSYRNKKYQLITKLTDKLVEKIPACSEADFQIQEMKKNIDIMKKHQLEIRDYFENDIIKSEYIEGKTFEEYLIDLYKDKGKDEVIKEIKKYIDYLKDKFVCETILTDEQTIFAQYELNIDEEHSNKFYYIKDGLLDLIFQNIFYVDKKYYFIDQEWYIENVPLEFIIFRSILHANMLRNYISYQDLLEELDLWEYRDLFMELEIRFQDSMTDQKFKSLFFNDNTVDNLIVTVKRQEAEIEAITKEIERLRKNEIELQNIKGSIVYRIWRKIKYDK